MAFGDADDPRSSHSKVATAIAWFTKRVIIKGKVAYATGIFMLHLREDQDRIGLLKPVIEAATGAIRTFDGYRQSPG